MAAFQYSFQKIVDLKKSEKTQAEWLLSNDLSILQSEERSLIQLQEDSLRLGDMMQDAAVNGSSLAELQMLQQYAEHIQILIDKKLMDVQRAEQAVEKSRSNLADRLIDEKVWLKAKENAFERFNHEMQVKEQNELDELATVRFMVSVP